MTLDEALELARQVESRSINRHAWLFADAINFAISAEQLARFVLDTLGQQMPCGFDEPRLLGDARDTTATHLLVTYDGSDYEPDEAIAIGAALLRVGLAAKGGR